MLTVKLKTMAHNMGFGAMRAKCKLSTKSTRGGSLRVELTKAFSLS